MKQYVIDIDSMDEADYSRARQLFDLLALTIGSGEVADAMIVTVPDEVAPVVVRVAGELGAVWYTLRTQEERDLTAKAAQEVPDAKVAKEEKERNHNVSVETADHADHIDPIDLVKEPDPAEREFRGPFPVREGGVERRCKNCGDPVTRGDYCHKQECKRVYARIWYGEHKGQKKGEGGSDSRHDPFGQTGAEAGDGLSVEAG